MEDPMPDIFAALAQLRHVFRKHNMVPPSAISIGNAETIAKIKYHLPLQYIEFSRNEGEQPVLAVFMGIKIVDERS